jgi:hypothetical protein
MRCTERSEIPIVLAIARPVQWVAWWGGGVQVSATSRAAVLAAIGALPGLRVFVAQQTLDPCLGKALLPPPHRRPADPDVVRHLLRRPAIRRGQHDARPLEVFARPVAVSHDRHQLLALCGVDNHTYALSHRPTPVKPRPQYRTSRRH